MVALLTTRYVTGIPRYHNRVIFDITTRAAACMFREIELTEGKRFYGFYPRARTGPFAVRL